MTDIRPNNVEFTQYLMPDGRQDIVQIERPAEIAAKAKEIVTAGFWFECEMLSDYNTISLTIVNDKKDLAIEVVPNGPEVPVAVDRLVMNFNLADEIAKATAAAA